MTARQGSRGLRATCLLLALGLLGCQTIAGLPLEELTEERIAFVYWDDESARRRADIIADRERGGGRTVTRRGVASMDSLALLMGGADGAARDIREFPGRIAFLNARTLELEIFAGAPPGARPLAWSRDRTRLLFASAHRGGTPQLYEFDLESGEVTILTRGDVLHMEGAYASDGRVAMSFFDPSAVGAEVGLRVVAPGGSDGPLVVDGKYPAGVRWSPTRDLLVWTLRDERQRRPAGARDRSHLFVQAPTPGVEARALSPGREPTFSPDGEWIVYSAWSQKGWHLRRIRPDGSARSALGVPTRDERNPAVSPDGRHLVYVSEEAGISRLYVRRFDGSGDRILLEQGGAAFPVW